MNKKSFHCRLKQFFEEIEEYRSEEERKIENIEYKLTEEETDRRVLFYRKMTSRFIQLHRCQNEITIEQMAGKLGWPIEQYEKYEKGLLSCQNEVFFQMVSLVKANHLVSLVLEQVEEALNPQIKRSRADLRDVLKQYGIFDSKQDHKEGMGQILAFNKANRRPK